MKQETADGESPGVVVTATEPVWVERDYRVTETGLEPITEPVTQDAIDGMAGESAYELEDGTVLNYWHEVEEYVEAQSQSEEKAQEYLQTVGKVPDTEESQ